MAALSRGTSDTTPPATPTTQSTPEPTQRSRTGVDAVDGEEDDVADVMFACVDALTAPLPSNTRSAFTGDCLAVAAQVRIIFSAFGLGELAAPQVHTETATQNAIQANGGPEGANAPLARHGGVQESGPECLHALGSRRYPGHF